MALDPRLLAALADGANASGTFDPSKITSNSAAKKPGAWNLGQWAIDVLSTGGYATAGVANKLGQNFNAAKSGDLGGVADALNPFSSIPAAMKGIAERRTYSDNLKDLGANDALATGLGLALDIGLDPTTYITGGMLAGVKGAAQGVKLAAVATKRGDTLAKLPAKAKRGADTIARNEGLLKAAKDTESAFVPVNRALTDSEKIGNLLTGINRGYQTGKTQFSVSKQNAKVSRLNLRDVNKLAKSNEVVSVPNVLNKAAARAADKLKAAELKANEIALPGIGAGTKKLTKKQIAAGAAAAKSADAVANLQKGSNNTFEVVLKTADGEVITDHLAIGKTYKNETTAAAASKRALAKIKKEKADLIDPNTQAAATNMAPDDQMRQALIGQAGAARELQGIEDSLVPLSAVSKGLDTFAKTIPLPGSYLAELKPAMTADLKGALPQIKQRLTDMANSELASLATSPEAISKLTTTKLLAIIKKPAANRTAGEQQIFEEIARQEIAIPADFNDLAAQIARTLEDEGVATLIKSDGTTSKIKTATKPERMQWASDINAQGLFKARLAQNRKLLSDTGAELVALNKKLYVQAAKYAKSSAALANAGKQDSAASIKLSDGIKDLNQKIDAKEVELSAIKQGNGPVGAGKYGWWTSTAKIVGDDYFAFVNRNSGEIPELDAPKIKAEKTEPDASDLIDPVEDIPNKSKKAELSKDDRKRLIEINRLLPTASKADKELLTAERATITTQTEIPAVIVAEITPAARAQKADRISRSGLAETATMSMLARMTKNADETVQSQAMKVFASGRDALAKSAAETKVELKPWIDGIISSDDTGKMTDAFIRFLVPELPAKSAAFKTITNLMEDLLEGKIAAVAGGKGVAVSSEDMAQIFEEFLSGRDFAKITDELGRIDLAKALEPGGYNSINELAIDLQDGKTMLSAPQLASLTRALGVAIDTTEAAKKAITTHTDSVSSLIDRSETLQGIKQASDKAAQLPSRMPITARMALEATGDSNGAASASALDDVMGMSKLGDDSEKIIAAVRAGEEADVVPGLSEEAIANGVRNREEATARLQAKIEAFPEDERLKIIRGVNEQIRDKLFPDLTARLALIAKARGESVEELLQKAFDGGWTSIVEDADSLIMSGAFRAGELATESRFTILNSLTVKGKGAISPYKDGGTGAEIFAREMKKLDLIEEWFRVVGIPVKSTENYAATLRRSGVAKTGEEISDQFVGLSSNITYTDILESLNNAGKSDLIWELRKYRGGQGKGLEQGNFPPNAIEAAWLTIKSYKANPKFVLTKGTPEYDEVMFSLSNIYKKPEGEGIQLKNIAVETLFEPSFQVRAATALGGADAAAIAKASDDIIEHLSGNFDELAKLDGSRTIEDASSDIPELFKQSSRLLLGMLRYQMGYRATKSGVVANNTLAKESALDTFGGLMKEHEGLIDVLSTRAFRDPKLAANANDLITNGMMNNRFAGATRSQNTATGLPALKRSLVKALSKKSEMAKVATTAEKAVERTKVEVKHLTEDLGIQVEIVRRTGVVPEEAATMSDDMQVALSNNVVHNHLSKTSAVEAKLLQEEEQLLQASVRSDTVLPKTKSGLEKGKRNFNPNAMTQGIKTAVNSTEMQVYSNSHRFSKIVEKFSKLYKGREAEITKSFAAVQKYRDAAADSAALGDEIEDITEWLASSDLVFDDEMVRVFDMLTRAIFGSESAFGVASRTGLMTSELNAQLQKAGLGALRLADDADIDTFWTRINIEDMGEGKNPLKYLDQINIAATRAVGQIAFGETLTLQFGRTIREIKDAGESVGDYVRIDKDDVIGRLLVDSDTLFHKDIIEKLRYVNDYFTYDKTFGDGFIAQLVRISDGIVSNMKATQTVFRPAHWVVSTVGEAAMNALAGVKGSSYGPVYRLMQQLDPGELGPDFEKMIDALVASSAPKNMKLKAGATSDVWFVKGDKRVIVNDELLVRAMKDNGIVMTPYASQLDDIVGAGESFKKGIFAPIQNLAAKLSPLAAKRDNIFRIAHFVDELKRTKADTFDEAVKLAATRVREWHPTVGSLSAAEQKYGRRLVYFYTWQKTALVKVIATMLEKPGIATIPSKFQYAFADYNGMNPESFGDPWDPNANYASYHTGQLFGPQFEGPDGKGDAWGIQPSIQPIDVVGQVFKPFTLQPGQNPIDSFFEGANSTFAGNLNPVIKMLMESSAKSRLGSGADLPGPAEYLISQVGVLSTLSKLTGVGQDPNPYETDEERRVNNARLLGNFFSGQRMTDYNSGGTDYKWKLDQQEMLKRMTGQ